MSHLLTTHNSKSTNGAFYRNWWGRLLPLLLFTSLLLPALISAPTVEAQEKTSLWANPSISPAPARPAIRGIFATPDGELQAFWIDRFDGMMTTLYRDGVWSLPSPTGPQSLYLGQTVNKVTAIPQIIPDNAGKLHFLATTDTDTDTGAAAVLYSQLPLGNLIWSRPTQVADSAAAYILLPTADGELKLIYLRPLKPFAAYNVPEAEPGIYVRGGSQNKIGNWGPATLIQSSIYYRTLTNKDAYLQAASTGNIISMIWSASPRLDGWLQPIRSTWAKPGASRSYCCPKVKLSNRKRCSLPPWQPCQRPRPAAHLAGYRPVWLRFVPAAVGAFFCTVE